MGCSVESLHQLGRGIPDLLVGHQGINHLVEVKTEKGKLNPTQKDWFTSWKGAIYTVKTVNDVISLVEQWNKN